MTNYPAIPRADSAPQESTRTLTSGGILALPPTALPPLAIYPAVLYPNPFLECPVSVMVLCLGRDGKKNERFLSTYHVLKSTCEKSVGMGEVGFRPWGRLPITPGQ